MTQRDMFGAAVWVGAPDRNYTDTAVLHTTVTHLWIMLLCMSAMGIVALAVFSKKKSVG